MDIMLGLMAFVGWVILPRTTMFIYVLIMVLNHKALLPV